MILLEISLNPKESQDKVYVNRQQWQRQVPCKSKTVPGSQDNQLNFLMPRPQKDFFYLYLFVLFVNK